ncbi:hypothetical protein STEG23_015230, partial [Scotinomys teguina]
MFENGPDTCAIKSGSQIDKGLISSCPFHSTHLGFYLAALQIVSGDATHGTPASGGSEDTCHCDSRPVASEVNAGPELCFNMLSVSQETGVWVPAVHYGCGHLVSGDPVVTAGLRVYTAVVPESVHSFNWRVPVSPTNWLSCSTQKKPGNEFKGLVYPTPRCSILLPMVPQRKAFEGLKGLCE